MNPLIYKLTKPDLTTHGEFLWTPGKWKTTLGVGNLCSPGWLHAYSDPCLAEFMNPIHGNFQSYRLWEAEWDGKFKDDRGLKLGVSKLRLIKELIPRNPTKEQRVEFAILVAREVFKNNKVWDAWAEDWLLGKDRSANAYIAAAAAANAVAVAVAAANAAALDLAGIARKVLGVEK